MEKIFDLPEVRSASPQSMAGGEYFAVSNRPPPELPIAGSTNVLLEGGRKVQGRRSTFTLLLLQAKSSLSVTKRTHSPIWEPMQLVA